MRRNPLVVSIISPALLALGMIPLWIPDTLSAGEPPRARYASGEVLIKFRHGAATNERVAARAQFGAVSRRTFASGAEHWRLGPGFTVEMAMRALKRNPHVEYVHPNHVIVPAAIPDDPRFGELWNLQNVGQTGGAIDADVDAELAWDLATGCGVGTPGCSGPVKVAVADTGIASHPDLEASVNRSESYDFANNDSNADPTCDVLSKQGHGTHVGGIIGAVGDNATGITGLNWRVSLMALKIFPNSGFEGFVADAVEAIDYAIDHGARVINASWLIEDCEPLPCAPTLYEAIRRAGDNGVLFVAAAGNSGNDIDLEPAYPPSYELDNIIAVAATDAADQIWSGSSYGLNSVDLGAPGVDVLSTLPPDLSMCGGPGQPPCPEEEPLCHPFGPGGQAYTIGDPTYDIKTGTSMAAPHVAGVAALMRAADPGATAAAIKSSILSSVDRLSTLAVTTVSGGRLNAHCALETLISDGDGDGRGDGCDNCPTVHNPDQTYVGAPVVTVIWPNGGETLTIGNNVTLQWSATDACGGVESVDLLLSRNGAGGPFDPIAIEQLNTGSYPWTVTGPATFGFRGFLKVVARDPEGNTGADLSNSGFRIKNPSCGPCQASYCAGEGVRCTFTGTCGAGGCCNYSCGTDWSCEGPDPCPPNACGCF